MKTKKITRKGCRNVQAVYEDGQWIVRKINPNKPATFITKKIITIRTIQGKTIKGRTIGL